MASRISLRSRRVLGIGLLLSQWLLAAACGDSHDDPSGSGGQTAENGGSSSDGGRSTGGALSRGGASTGSGGRVVANGGTRPEGGTNASGDGGVGGIGDVGPHYEYPLRLTPIGNVDASTAHVSLYFTASDANNVPVRGLHDADFLAREDSVSIDPDESAFRVTNPKAKLVIPTVLLLDLSRSVANKNGIPAVKDAAHAVVAKMTPEQRLAILTFSEQAQTLVDFTTDTAELDRQIDMLQSGGISTNLYGALQTGFAKWNDGFYQYDSTANGPQLVSGLLIVVTDGNDTAGVSTLSATLAARGNKRTIFIPIGTEVDETIANQIGKDGVFDARNGFSDLGNAVGSALTRVEELNSAIYAAEYCSPKLAGSHELLFTVKGNQPYLGTGGASNSGSNQCKSYGPGPSCGGTDLYCGTDPTDAQSYLCCPADAPYHCAAKNWCYTTAESAFAACGSSCGMCTAPNSSSSNDTAPAAGPSIKVNFSAQGFSPSTQCADLFQDPDVGAGGAGGASGAAGSGGAK